MDNSLVVQLGMDLSKMEAGLHKSNDLLEGFQEQVAEIGSGIAAAFAVEKVAEFAFEVSELAGKASGVKQAFNQLPESTALMYQLQETTHDTVDQLTLMGYAVHAQNLNIPLKDLGEILEFAHIRALATNKDFNDLANTLITAIGKGGAGAKKAMAELQISTEDYTKALKETGNVTDAVMKLAKEAIEKNKGTADSTLQSIEQLKASWKDLQIAIGETLNKTGILSGALNAISGEMKILNSEGLTWYEKMLLSYAPLEAQRSVLHALAEEEKKRAESSKDQVAAFDAYYNNIKKVEGPIKNIAFYENEIKTLRQQESEQIGQELTNTQRTIELEQEKLEVLKLQYATQRDMANTATLGKMKGFDTSISGVGTANTNLLPPSENIDKANKAIQTTIDLLHKQTKAGDEAAYSLNQIYDEKRLEKFTETLRNGMVSVVSALAEGIGEMAAGAASSDQVFAMVLQSAAGMLRQLGELAISAGITAIALENLLDNPYTAIAAGIALVALSGAVSGAAKNIVSGHGGGGQVSSASSFARPTDNSTQVYGSVKISGQDLFVILSNYKNNSGYTRIG